MRPEGPTDRLERHALVLALWLPLGLLAAGLFHHGFGAGGPWWIAAGFGSVLAGFVAHVIVNAAFGTGFSGREIALALVLFGLTVITLVLSVLLDGAFSARFLLPVALGLIGLALAVVFYMVTRFGTRGAFERFDLARENNPRPASRLLHRGRRP